MNNRLSIEEILEIPENERNSIESLLVSLWESDEDNGLAVLNAAYEYLELKKNALHA